MHINKRVFLLIICITVLSFTLTGCYDLGDAAENDEEYCDLYPDIEVIYGSSSSDSYDMEDFYNKEAVNDFKSPMDEDDRKYYSYLIIKVAKDISVGSIAVHFESTVQETLNVSFFILNESDLPSKIYTGKDGTYKLSESNEPDPRNALGHASCTLTGVANKWKAVVLTAWTDGDTTSKRHSVSKGQYIVLRLDNNCYDRALAEFEEAQEEWEKIQEDYSADRIDYSEYIIGERDFNAAREKYEREKSPYKAMPVRITAILINAE